MADLPPPYSPRDDAAGTTTAPQVILSPPDRAASPPPSYDTVVEPQTSPGASAAPRIARPPQRLSAADGRPLAQTRSHSPSAVPSLSPVSPRAPETGGRRSSFLSAFRGPRSPSPRQARAEAIAWAHNAWADADVRDASAASAASASGRSASVSAMSPAFRPSSAGSQLVKASAAANSNTPTDEQQILAAMFRMFPWRTSWGPVPDNLDSALREAALNAHEGLVRALLRNGAPIKYTDRYAAFKRPNGSALHTALRSGMPQLAETILDVFWQRAYEAALKQRITHKNGLSALERARDPGDDEASGAAVAAVIAADKETRSLLDGRDNDGCTPLHLAASAGETDQVRALLRRGAELDVADAYGRTPLHMAARYSRKDTAAYLLGQGASTKQLLAPGLWDGVSGKGLDDLGSYEQIGRLIRGLLAEEQKRPVDDTAKAKGQDGSSQAVSASSSSSAAAAAPAAAAAAPYRITSSLLNPGSALPKPEFMHDLGSYEQIGRLIQGLLAEEQKLPVDGMAKGKGQDGASQAVSASSSSSAAAATSSRVTSSLLDPGPALPKPKFVHGSSAPQPKPNDDPYDLSKLSSISRKARGPIDPGRKVAPSSLHTPEYQIWKSGLDSVQAEHRAQRARNKQTEDVSDLFQ